MNAVLRAPLVAAAAVAIACALAGMAHPAGALACGLIVTLTAGPLALVSADRPRRIAWTSVAIAGAGSAIRSFLALPPIEISAEPHVAALREALGVPLRTMIPEPESGIVLGIVLGERASIPRDLKLAFAVTGTTHILAISGFNMTLVAAAATALLRHRVRPAVTAIVTVTAVAGYTILVGPQASVVRAALMAAVGALGLALGRRGLAANALGGAVVTMLVIDPLAIEDAGFLLSVSSTAGLIALDRPVRERLERFPGWIREGLSSTVAASIPTLPLVAAIFGRISIVSPLANLIVVPLFAPIMVFGAVTAVVGAIWPGAAWPLAMATFVAATAFRRVVELCAVLPFAALSVPPGAGVGGVVAVAMLVIAFGVPRLMDLFPPPALPTLVMPGIPSIDLPVPRVAMPELSGRARRVALVAAIVGLGTATLLASALAASTLTRSSSFRVRALDVGQGDAFLIESAGRYALIDGGPDTTTVLRQLGAALPPWQRRIDLVALTHEHADHGTGLLGVIAHYEIGLAIEPIGMEDVPFVHQWSDALASAHVPRRAVAAGASVRVGGVTLRIVGPGRDRKVAVPSLAIHASSASSSALFLGDSTDDELADLLLVPGELRSRLFIPQHHGAESVHTAELVEAVHPEAAVISVGALNKYGHPTPATLAALRGLPVYRTDRYGTVDLELDGHPLVIHTAKGDLPPDRGGSVPSASPAR